MVSSPSESLESLKLRAERMERPTRTSPYFKWLGLAIIAVGFISLGNGIFNPANPLWMTWLLVILGLVLFVTGGVVLTAKSISSHSESVEADERKSLINERSKSKRCIYIEGNVPDGKGLVGRCKLYEFDMVDYPYCLYCREYRAQQGNPDV